MNHQAVRAARPALRTRVAWIYSAAGLGLCVSLVLLRHTDLAAVPLGLAGLGAAFSSSLGRLRNRPANALPWTLLSLACVAFMVGAVLRQVLVGHASAPLADAATLTGYGALLGGYVALLRNRRTTGRARHDVIDGTIVLVAVGALVLVALTLPTAAVGGMSPVAFVQSAYPVIDVLVLFVAVLLSWTSATRSPAYWFLSGAMLFTLAGDLGYAVIATRGELVGSALLDLPFVAAFTLLGAAALHPSMVALSASQPRPVQAWSRARLALIAPAMLLPATVVIGYPGQAPNWIGGVAGVLVTLLLVIRALAAVQDHAHAQEVLLHQATHDHLTGLTNRAGLVARIEALIKRARLHDGRVDLLLIDVDAFKLVNDTWGHHVGDSVLQRAGDRLLSLATPGDVVARVGGDEFVVARYVGPSGEGSGELLAADIVESFRRPLTGGAGDLVTTVSIGLARNNNESTAELLLRDADTAMYRAKAAGRSRCMVFDPQMRDSMRARVDTEVALRQALERGELSLHYQPIVSLQSGGIAGVEALLRWTHPTLGMVPPLEFIPIAEETDLIVAIGEWVITEALHQLASWRDSSTSAGDGRLTVSVNVSARQLRDGALVAHVATELDRLGVPAELLVLEITETAMMADEAMAATFLGRLRNLGVTLAVDDFGTGYSSLGHLRRFPVSKVKIDRTFVAGIEQNVDDAEIVRAVVAMSLAMGLEVVAEGIETEGQRVLLQQLGVQLGQGWLFGRPAPADRCALLLAGEPA